MHLTELVNRPLGDIGFQKDQLLIAWPQQSLDGAVMRDIHRASLRHALPRFFADLRGPIQEVRITAISGTHLDPPALYIDATDNHSWSRILLRNETKGIVAEYRPIDVAGPLESAKMLKGDTGEKAVQIDFFSQRDHVRFKVAAWDSATGFAIWVHIDSLELDGYQLKEVEGFSGPFPTSPPEGFQASLLDANSTSIEDCILSLRSGMLLAQAQSVLGADSPEGGRAAPVLALASLAASDAESTYVESEAVEHRDADVAIPGLPDDPSVRLSARFSDLDFSRIFREANAIIKPELVIGALRYGRRHRPQGIGSIAGRLKAAAAAIPLTPDSYDPEPFEEIGNVLSTETDMGLIFPAMRTFPAPETANRIVTASVTPKLLRQCLGGSNIDTQFESVKRELDPYASLTPMSASLLSSSFIEPMVILPSTEGCVYTDMLANPFILAGSMQAKVLALLAETAVMQTTAEQPWKASEFLLRMRRMADESRQRTFGLFTSSTKAAGKPNEILSLASSSFALGMMNFSSHLDTTDYRLGLKAGRLEGARVIYDQLRAHLQDQINLEPLPDGANLQQILNYIATAAARINETIDEINEVLRAARQTINNLNDTIRNLHDEIGDLTRQLEATAQQWQRTGKAFSVLAGAATGALIGGPIGAVIGGVIGGLFG